MDPNEVLKRIAGLLSDGPDELRAVVAEKLETATFKGKMYLNNLIFLAKDLDHLCSEYEGTFLELCDYGYSEEDYREGR